LGNWFGGIGFGPGICSFLMSQVQLSPVSI